MQHSLSPHRYQRGFIAQAFLVIVLAVALCIFIARAYILPPSNFPLETTFEIKKGDDLGAVAHRLQQAHIVKSGEAFKLIMLAIGGDQHLNVGSYYFQVPITSLEVALKISGKSFGILQYKVTFPEGFSNKEIAARLAARFPGFDNEAFLAFAKDKQGYLFPDTYSFDPQVTAQVVIDTMNETYAQKTSVLAVDIAASGRTEKDIVIMASILEKEAANADEMPIIAGILWKRIDSGKPLQVDAPLAQMLGKTSAQLTTRDLASTSPYNTYTHTGLPPAPINNPGLDAITAAIHPVASSYWYYLHDAQGTVHYASTFEAHKANKAKYLK